MKWFRRNKVEQNDRLQALDQEAKAEFLVPERPGPTTETVTKKLFRVDYVDNSPSIHVEGNGMDSVQYKDAVALIRIYSVQYAWTLDHDECVTREFVSRDHTFYACTWKSKAVENGVAFIQQALVRAIVVEEEEEEEVPIT